VVRKARPGERAAARNILRNFLRVKRGENVLIEVWEHSLPFASAFVDETCRIGAIPYIQYQDRDTFWSEFRRGSPAYFGTVGAIEKAALEAADAYIYFMGPDDLFRSFQLKRSSRFWKKFFAYQEPFYEIARRTGLRGSRMSIAYADQSDAKRWGVDRSAWHRELMNAYQTPPKSMLREGARLTASLSGGRRVTITHPNGTALDIGLKRTRPRIFTGVHAEDDTRSRTEGWGDPALLNDLPWGVLSVATDEGSADGVLVSNRPSYYGWGMTDGARWRFKAGRLVEVRFDRGARSFSHRFRTRPPRYDRIGSLLFGLNPAIHHSPNVQFAERGSLSVQLGKEQISSDYPSSRLPKATVAGAIVRVDDRPIVRSGRIL